MSRRVVIQFVYMNEHEIGVSQRVAHEVATDSGGVATTSPTPRQDYTMTVERVARMLADQSTPRDNRTIQRWCKSGRLVAIIDQENADRYLISEASARNIVATLLADKHRIEADMSRHDEQRRDAAATASDAPTAEVNKPPENRDDAAATEAEATRDTEAASHDAATTADDTNEPAATSSEVSQLKAKIALLEADVKSRDGLVSYMTGQFEKTMDVALERSQELGIMQERVRSLEIEKKELQAQLPAPAAPVVPNLSFRPRSVEEGGDSEGGGHQSSGV